MIDVLIPAYNNPATLQRAIESIYKQTYRPITVTVFDDNSPTELEPTLRACFKSEDRGLSIRLRRNTKNLRPYWNCIALLQTVKANNYIFLAHDDYFIDDFFFETASDLISNRMCALVIGNSQYEGSTELMMQKYFQDFLEVYGNFYISGPLWTDAHPAYSGVMFNSQVAKTFLNSGLVLEQERCHQFNIEPDEGFLSIILGALNKKIAISGIDLY